MKVINCLKPHHIEDLYHLYKQEWWTKDRSLEETRQGVNGSQICIGLIDDNDVLQGFARVLTDYTFKALIFDVIVSNSQRKKGLGDKLIKLVKAHPKLSNVTSFELYCVPELQPFYQTHGFSSNLGNIHLMRLVKS